jgi:DNA-binding MarR family transcriptional regulator
MTDSRDPVTQYPFLPTLRELVRTYQAFSLVDEAQIRTYGLTASQFDVVATLGNTNGMTMSDLAEKTLVTKGTLTGIVDRLEAKQFVRREVPEGDRRCFKVVLTEAGEALFQEIFPKHMAFLQERFDRLEMSELELLGVLLRRVRSAFAD